MYNQTSKLHFKTDKDYLTLDNLVSNFYAQSALLLNYIPMWQNFLKTSFRNFLNNRTYTLINISGLSLGMLTCILIALFVWDEKSYDTFVPESEKIFRVYNKVKNNESGRTMAAISPMFKPTLQAEFPETDTALRIINFFGNTTFQIDDKITYEEDGVFAEAQFLNFFGISLKEGDPETALQEINSIVLSEQLANKYFPDKSPIGETIFVDEREVKITGVLDKLPGNFHLKLNFISSFATVEALIRKERMQSWVWQQFYTYVKVKQAEQEKVLEEKFQDYVVEHAHPETSKIGFTYLPQLQPLKEVYLNSYGFEADIAQHGNINYVNALSLVAIFILVIACINFINLSTARSVKRAKEVGIRKTAGAKKTQLIGQFLMEAFLLVIVSSVIACIAVELALPYLNAFAEKSITFNPITSFETLAGLIVFIFTITLLSGIYPAFIVSGFAPLSAIKQQKSGSKKTVRLRQVLVVLQFGVSTLVIVFTLVIYQQLNFLENKDHGFQRERLITFPMEGKIRNSQEEFKNSLTSINGVETASYCFGIPGDIVAGDNIRVPNKETKLPVSLFTVDHDYAQTLQLELLQGRDFNKDLASDQDEAFIINETAVGTFGFESAEAAIGKELQWDMWYGNNEVKKGVVIGVAKDFHFNSLHQKVEPAVLHVYPRAYRYMIARITPNGDIAKTVESIDELWKEYVDKPFDYQFVDQSFDEAYKAEQKLGSIFLLFAIISVFIACFGLFGLVSFSTEQRRKEIGIRKVLGAGEFKITVMLVQQLSQLVLIAALIALPAGYYFAQDWLQAFAYSVPISILPFALSIFFILGIAWLTVSYHALSTALEKPVNSLRSE